MSLIPVTSSAENPSETTSSTLLYQSFTTTTQSAVVPSPRNGLRKKNDEKPRDIAPFLKNLRKMLDMECPTILCWTKDGKAFEIRDMDKMMEFVLPKYFKHRKYTSFQRQLNYFNFKKWTKSKAVICTFSNEFFLRDDMNAALRISRKKSASVEGNNGSIKRRISKSGIAAPLIRRSCTLARSISQTIFNVGEAVREADKLGIAIPISEAQAYGSCGAAFSTSYPSPTDVDLMLQDVDPSICQNMKCDGEGGPQEGLNGSEFTLDCLDWIDLIMPTIETHEHAEQGIQFNQSKKKLQNTCAFQCDVPAKAELHDDNFHSDNVRDTFGSLPKDIHNN